MIELELLGRRHDDLILVDANGERYSIVVDDFLRAAVRRDADPGIAEQRVTIHPGKASVKDIQGYLRAGMSVAEICTHTGLSEAQVVRYESPIAAERSFIVDQVKKSYLSWDRDALTVGDLTVSRLVSRGIDPTTLQWTATREGQNPWVVRATYVQDARELTATWTFDRKTRVLTPRDDESRWITEAGLPCRSDVFDQEKTTRRASHSSHPQSAPLTVNTAYMSSQEPRPVTATPGAAPMVSTTEALLEELSATRGQRMPALYEDLDDVAADGDDLASPAGVAPGEDAGHAALPRSAHSGSGSAGSAASVVPLPRRDKAARGENSSAGAAPQDSSAQGATPHDAAPADSASHESAATDHAEDAARTPSPDADMSPDTQAQALEAPTAPTSTRGVRKRAVMPDARPATSTAGVPRIDSDQEELPGLPASDTPVRKRSPRRSVPSWDDIMFGSKSE